MTKNLRGLNNLSYETLRLSWSDMVTLSGFIADQIPHLEKAGGLDRDGIAGLLDEFANDVRKAIKEADGSPKT